MAKRAEPTDGANESGDPPKRPASASLYRKHRPQRFAEMVGQEHVTSALRHTLLSDSVGHAYLFSGPRGTGKTTTARIFAKALNCIQLGDDGEPCGTCVNCGGFSADGITFADLFELDAASNNGVDAMRDLIQRVSLGIGATSKRKVYLIDEVHMLSAGAANALLKTLEEPPSHVVFVLATTDPQKVLPTVRSRTQHFDFKLLSPDQLRELVGVNLEREGIQADAEAVELIVRKAAGSGRDSLSLLDQAIALGQGSLDAEHITAMLGSTDFARLTAILRAIAAEDVAETLVVASETFAAGVDVRRLADDLLRTMRDAFVHVAAKGRVPYDGPETDLAALSELAEAFGLAGLTRGIEVLGETIADIRSQQVPDPRLLLEVALVRLARREARTAIETLTERLDRLERQLGEGGAPTPAPRRAEAAPSGEPAAPREPRTSRAPSAPATPKEPSAPKEASAPRTPRATLGAHRRPAPATGPAPEAEQPAHPERTADASARPAEPVLLPATALDLDDVIVAWSAALQAMKPPVRAAVADAQPIAVDRDVVTFGVPSGPRAEMQKKRFKDEAGDVKRALSDQLGSVPRFKVVSHDFARPDAFVSASSSQSDAGDPPPPVDDDIPDDAIDLDELIDAPRAAAPSDSATRLVEAFPGAQVVSEQPR